MAEKYYAVRVGRKTGIFTSWEECKAQIDGYKCASYKSFKTKKEAEEFMGIAGGAMSNDNDSVNNQKDYAIAYVDGSFNIATQVCGFGVVFFYDGLETHLNGSFSDKSLSTMRNVAGEIKGSEAAIRHAMSKNIKNIKIYHDYEGIAKWCTGEWKANKEGTIAYQQFFKEASNSINIQFVKVKGHSGDKYNDVADELAKQACGVI